MEIAYDSAQGKITWDKMPLGGGYEIQYAVDTLPLIWHTWFTTTNENLCECSFDSSNPGVGQYKGRGKTKTGGVGPIININIIA